MIGRIILPLVIGALAVPSSPRAVGAPSAMPRTEARQRPSFRTAVVSGEVVDAVSRIGLPASIVVLRSRDGHETAEVTTSSGSFTFEGIARGRYQLSARKPGYVGMSFGAQTFDAEGVPLAVDGAQPISNLVVALPPGGVIAGRVLSDQGTGKAHVRVQLAPAQRGPELIGPLMGPFNAGGIDSVVTNDLGEFRFFGLPGGEYFVSAIVGFTEQPGAAAPIAVYYADALDRRNALPVRVEEGGEVTGINLTQRRVPTGRIVGKVVLPGETRESAVRIDLIRDGQVARTVTAAGDGSFVVPAIVPGQYTVAARLDTRRPRASNVGTGLWGATDVQVGVSSTADILIVARPAAAFAARIVVVDGTSASAPHVRVTLVPVDGVGRRAAGVSDDQGMLTIAEVIPGAYRLACTVDASPAESDQWTIESGEYGDRDILDVPFTVPEALTAISAEIKVRRRVQGITGILLGSDERPALALTIVAFPARRDYWWIGSRRIRSSRPATDGTFEFLGLPAGEYLVAAVAGRDPLFRHMSPDFESLAAAAVRIVVDSGRVTSQALQVAVRPPTAN